MGWQCSIPVLNRSLDTTTIKQTIKKCRYVLHRKQWVSKTLPEFQRINRKEEEEEEQEQEQEQEQQQQQQQQHQQKQQQQQLQLKPPEVSVALCHDHVFAVMDTVQQDHS